MKVERIVNGPVMTNTYIVTDNTKDAFMVDPGTYMREVTDMLKKSGKTLKYIILTHAHADHTGGVQGFLRDFPDAELVACIKEKELLNLPEHNASIELSGQPIIINPNIYVKDGDSLMCGEMKLKFIETPGHTKGGMCVYTGDVLFSGDTLFYASIGRTDFYGGNYDELVSSVKDKLFKLPDETKVYPGHNIETTIGYEKIHNPFC